MIDPGRDHATSEQHIAPRPPEGGQRFACSFGAFLVFGSWKAEREVQALD